MSTNKPIVHELAKIAVAKGVRHAIISSGSRNAPIVIAFNSQKKINCLSVIDERSAGFFALGIAQQTGEPVALICTSGSAVLNYAPAIVEAYYQKVPLMVLTADRPTEWIDQDDGQTIRQPFIYNNYIKASYTLPAEGTHVDDIWYTQRVASEAFNVATEKGNEGPVHINIPLREPLYGESGGMDAKVRKIERAEVNKVLSAESENEIVKEWNRAKRKMIICGLHRPDKKLNELLSTIAEDSSVVVITETTSNMFDEKFVCNVDGYFESLTEAEKIALQPGLLITFGGPVTTKKFKAYIRKHKPLQHWHVSSNATHVDTYQSLTNVLPVDEISFFSLLAKQKGDGKSTYAEKINKIAKKAFVRLEKYNKQIPFSDIKAFETIWANLPEKSNVQLGNSSPIRYANLMDTSHLQGVYYYSNRGVSGIDGSLSTASGAAYASERITTLIVGDLGFMYDMNGLWNKNLSPNLRIIVINNGGGGIFRIIDSRETPLLEKYFEAVHNMKVEPFAKAFEIPYYAAYDEESLRQGLSSLYQDVSSKGLGGKRPVILEVFTPRTINAEVLLDYFNFLKK
jgi:2-succinyl-5-enolpyruvyl-6-hydroxy-3-cyclohexene-1-carboxylate synthase